MSTFTFDDFDALLNSVASLAPGVAGVASSLPSVLSGVTPMMAPIPPLTGHASITTGGTTPSSESTPYTLLGATLVAGGVGGSSGSGKKRVGILVSPSAEELCMGLINNSKFCTRKNSTCIVVAHTSKKFLPSESMSYLRDTEIRAWCHPVLDTSKLNCA